MNYPVPMLLLAAVLSATQLPGPPANASPRPKRAEVEHHTAEFRSMQQKIEYLRQNAARSTPDPRPTELTEAEVNAYFNEGGVKLPKGVSRVRLSSQPAVIDGRAQIDFDALTEGRRTMNPLLSLFSGTHQVRVAAQAVGEAGSGSIKVQSVYLDGMEVPPMALEFFARYYLTPRYPNVGVNTTFRLPLRIDSAIVEAGRVRLAQR